MSRQATADQALVRKLNTAIVLDTLRRSAPLSRAELSFQTGLNRSTVSSIVNSQIDGGFVQETDLQNSKLGRPGMLLMLNPKGGFAIGIEIGVDFISAILTDFTAHVLWRRRVVTDPGMQQIDIIERAGSLTQEALKTGLAQGLRPLGIGIGLPGLVDINQGKLVLAPNLHWSNVPFRLLWTQNFNLPVFVENEANAAALGEYYFGVARGVENFIYLSAGVGLGSGILIGGKLFRGSAGYSSEVGHMMVDPQGELCGCGKRGCWETLVGPRAVMRRVQNTLQSGAQSIMCDLVEGDLQRLNFEVVIEAARQSDPVAIAALQEVGRNLGIGVANLVNIFNPELVVLGGALNLASPYLLPVMEQTVAENSLQPAFENLRIAASAHGTDTCVMGAIALVLDDILREPMFS